MGKNKNEGARVVPSQVKDPTLIDRRRLQIVDAAVHLFIDKGFHRTTTREIARAAGISIGLLYEYVASKEDVLYLVCDAIHAEMERGVAEALRRAARGRDKLAAMIREYIRVCDRMSDHILLVYQETRALPDHWRNRVLENEVRVTEIFLSALDDLIASGQLPRLERKTKQLIAHDITVFGHMWTFRRWFLASRYTLEEYIRRQTDIILGRVLGEGRSRRTKEKK